MRKLPKIPRRRLRRALTTPNVLATIAVLMSLTGTAFAAVTLTGANVRDSTLTGVDFKDVSINGAAFSSTTKTAMKARVGAAGAAGAIGPAGNPGSNGAAGIKGVDAARSYSYITADDTTGMLAPKTTNLLNPPSGGDKDCGMGSAPSLPASLGFGTGPHCAAYAPYYPHWAYDCGGTKYYCGWVGQIGGAGTGATMLTSGATGVVGFTGDENGSFVSLMGPGNIIVTGSLTLLRRTEGYHARISCQPRVRQSNSADTHTNMGVPTVVSSNEIMGIVHITVTGGTYLPTAGDYDYEIACRLVDEYDANDEFGDWFFIAGNATATTTEL